MSRSIPSPRLADYVNGKTLPLPYELRQCIYERVFQGQFLHIDIPNRFPQDGFIRSDASKNASVPGLLAVSKTTREEAFAPFVRLVPPVFHCPSREWQGRPGLVLPTTFLQHATVAYIANFYVTGVDHSLMPNLKELRIGGAPTGATEGIVGKAPVDRYRWVFEAFKEHYVRQSLY